MSVIRAARRALTILPARLIAPGDRERGDVPGWVMITLMTAVLVVLIWGIASNQLQSLLNSAFGKVSNQSNSGG